MQSGAVNHDIATIEYFTPEEIQQIVQWFFTRRDNKHRFERDRYFLLMKVLLRTGARKSEVLFLKPADFDIYNNTVQLITLKRKKKDNPIRTIPLHSDLKDTLSTYLLTYPNRIEKGKRMFPMSPTTVSQFFQDMGKDLGFNIYPHKFRHTFAVNALMNNVPLNVIQKWLGHSSIFTTSIYTELGSVDTQKWMSQL